MVASVSISNTPIVGGLCLVNRMKWSVNITNDGDENLIQVNITDRLPEAVDFETWQLVSISPNLQLQLVDAAERIYQFSMNPTSSPLLPGQSVSFELESTDATLENTNGTLVNGVNFFGFGDTGSVEQLSTANMVLNKDLNYEIFVEPQQASVIVGQVESFKIRVKAGLGFNGNRQYAGDLMLPQGTSQDWTVSQLNENMRPIEDDNFVFDGILFRTRPMSAGQEASFVVSRVTTEPGTTTLKLLVTLWQDTCVPYLETEGSSQVLPATANLSLTQSVDQPLIAGQNGTYRFSIKNESAVAATGVVVKGERTVASRLRYSNPNNYLDVSLDDGNYTWTVGTLAAGATRNIILGLEPEVPMPPVGDFSVSAFVSGNNLGTVSPSNPIVTPFSVTEAPNPDFSVEVTQPLNGDELPANQLATFVGRLTNTGNVPLNFVTSRLFFQTTSGADFVPTGQINQYYQNVVTQPGTAGTISVLWSNPIGSSLNPGQSTNFIANATPTGAGSHLLSLGSTLSYNGNNIVKQSSIVNFSVAEPANPDFSVEVTQPLNGAELPANQLAFVGRLTNTGNVPLNFVTSRLFFQTTSGSQFVPTGQNNQYYQNVNTQPGAAGTISVLWSNPIGSSLNPGQSTDFIANAPPAGAGSHSLILGSTLSYNGNNIVKQSSTVNFSVVEAPIIAFSLVETARNSTAPYSQTFTITNTGNINLTGGSGSYMITAAQNLATASATGGFTFQGIGNNTYTLAGPAVLSPGSSGTYTFTYTLAVAGGLPFDMKFGFNETPEDQITGDLTQPLNPLVQPFTLDGIVTVSDGRSRTHTRRHVVASGYMTNDGIIINGAQLDDAKKQITASASSANNVAASNSRAASQQIKVKVMRASQETQAVQQQKQEQSQIPPHARNNARLMKLVQWANNV